MYPEMTVRTQQDHEMYYSAAIEKSYLDAEEVHPEDLHLCEMFYSRKDGRELYTLPLDIEVRVVCPFRGYKTMKVLRYGNAYAVGRAYTK